MDGLGELEGGGARASDGDRNRVTEELRVDCVAGRITLEEWSGASSARCRHRPFTSWPRSYTTCRRLASRRSAQTVPYVSGSGLLGFDHSRAESSFQHQPIERTRSVALDTIAPGLNGVGYELKRQSPTGLEFQRTAKERIVIALEPTGTNATTMIVHGRAARHIRKTFPNLSFR